MASGGARARSGPAPIPGSVRSAKRGVQFTDLPDSGYAGPVPEFPLPDPTPRELEFYAELWATPQATIWAREPWRIHAVGLYARWGVRAESPLSPAALLAQTHRLADQLGLTPAGLRENRWLPPRPVAATEGRPVAALRPGSSLDLARQLAARPADPRDVLYQE